MQKTLSPSEKRLCRLRAQGLKMQEIADICNYTHGTVRTYFHRIYQKIGRQEVDMSMVRNASDINELQLAKRP